MIKRSVIEKGIVADLFLDGSGQPRKALVLMGGSEGGKVWSSFGTSKPRKPLLDLGYTLLSLAYFKAPGLPTTLESIPLEYFKKVFAWFATQPEVISDEIALIGASKGAEAALVLGSMNPKIIVELSGERPTLCLECAPVLEYWHHAWHCAIWNPARTIRAGSSKRRASRESQHPCRENPGRPPADFRKTRQYVACNPDVRTNDEPFDCQGIRLSQYAYCLRCRPPGIYSEERLLESHRWLPERSRCPALHSLT
jgi:hypothetical protein